MRTGARVFLGSATFALVISSLYWFITSEPAGTALLLSMILAPGMMAAYAAASSSGLERPPEDRPDADPAASDARVLGPVIPASIWPAALGVGALLVAAGLAYGVWLLLVAGAAFVVALIGLTRE